MRDTEGQRTGVLQRIVTDVIVIASFAAIAVTVVMTVGDVLVRLAADVAGAALEARPRWGLYGLVDLTQLAMMAAAPLAIAAAFFLGSHIKVDLFYARFSRRMRRLSIRLSALVGAVTLGICLWTAWREMRMQMDFITTSSTLGIAYTWYWAPLIAGLALSVLGCCVVLIRPDSDGYDDV